jgi:phage terminase large subunit-like protein
MISASISSGPSWPLPSIPPEALAERLRSKLAQKIRENKIADYRPYPKQIKFHEAGLKFRERLFRAGNQLGKSFSGGAEAAYHATGLYPEWWSGRRLEQGNSGWVGGPSGELVRDGAQRVLLGRPDDWGTGSIPKHAILDISRAQGVRDMVDTVTIRHQSGMTSRIKFKTYDQGRLRWQAETLDWVWFDEEPDSEIYMEGLSRTNATGGFIWLTFTPLLGVSDVVMRFLKETSPDRSDTVMTIEDAEHIPPLERQKIIDSYPPHEREARTRGIPILGSGRIFPFPRDMLACQQFPIPKHWPRIGGLDIGWDHPTAAVEIAHDRDSDTIYVINAYRQREQTVAVHAGALVPWGKNLPWAWPHDAFQHDKASGEQIASLYARHGLKMLEVHSQFADDRGNGVEAGIFEMVDRMQTARFKVFEHLNDWFEEFELYHRKDNKVFKERDDLLSATRYAIMMLRFAKSAPIPYDAYARRRTNRERSPWAA